MRLNVLFTAVLSAAAAGAAATAHHKRQDITVDFAVIQDAAAAVRESINTLGALQADISSRVGAIPFQDGLQDVLGRAEGDAADLAATWDQLAGALEASATSFQDADQGVADVLDAFGR
jgi:uncharacterized protein YukE